MESRLWQQLAQASRARSEEHVGSGAGVDGISTAVDAVFEVGEQWQRAAPANRQTACGKGCSYCCYMRVVATVPEVLRIMVYVLATHAAAERESLAERVVAIDDRARGMSDEMRGEARLPCPLLVAGECSVYRVRPLDCRAYNSRSVGACRDAFERYSDWDVPVDAEHQSAYKSVQAGLLQALAGSGRPATLVELTAALRLVLDDHSIAQRWCEGENAFTAAELDPDDPEQRAFLPWTPSDSLRSLVD